MSKTGSDSEAFAGYRALADRLHSPTFNDRPDLETAASLSSTVSAARALHADQPLLADMYEFELRLDSSARSEWLEPVPSNMLGVFAEEQWPDLKIEFQPGLHVIQSRWDLITMRQALIAEPTSAFLPEIGEAGFWLVLPSRNETRIRSSSEEEISALRKFEAGERVSEIFETSDNETEEQTLEKLNRAVVLISDWCDENIVVDIGVPVPENAKFESDG
ncbi:MAG: hypothetical protein AAF402_04280 [Pseudomonadota bacterium]